MSTQWQNSRKLSERIVVTGWLTLETPAHFGNGDSEGLLDMPLHLDAVDGCTLITGSSLAGALRNYVYQSNPYFAEQLFGRVDNTAERGVSEESLVIIDDALGGKPSVEVRDGVAIDPETRTSDDKFKFDIELLTAGSRFPLSFELQLRKTIRSEERTQLLQNFALALNGLAQGEIRLGKRKRRGFGLCRAHGWLVDRFDMTAPQDMVKWLRFRPTFADPAQTQQENIFQKLKVAPIAPPQAACKLNATFRIDGSLLVRSEPVDIIAPDAVHLHSKRNGKEQPVLSGTSVAGALRAQALRIANTLGKDGYDIVNDLFGYRDKNSNDAKDKRNDPPLSASRLWVDETVIEQPLSLVQQRVKIDRFTGGSYPGALFAVEPVFGSHKTRAHIRLRLDAAANELQTAAEATESARQTTAEIGILLLLLKDLWTGELPLGGEISVGRGRLVGEEATITIGPQRWVITPGKEGQLQISDGKAEELESYVNAFVGFTRKDTCKDKEEA